MTYKHFQDSMLYPSKGLSTSAWRRAPSQNPLTSEAPQCVVLDVGGGWPICAVRTYFARLVSSLRYGRECARLLPVCRVTNTRPLGEHCFLSTVLSHPEPGLGLSLPPTLHRQQIRSGVHDENYVPFQFTGGRGWGVHESPSICKPRKGKRKEWWRS